ncbi:MAG: DUF1795 domain-containing protein [Chthoniobacter sp.]|nr:DUF1795 domain-containing protein [Chthoniobacter sp.]
MIRRTHLTTLAAATALAAAGCDREEIRVYSVAKETAPAPAPGASSAPTPAANTPRPQLAYTLPAGWQDAGPTAMSLANFRIKTDAGEASVNITPLASMAGQEAIVVNMWREQVGQKPLADGELAGALTPVEIGGAPGQLFEISGQRDGQTVRIITAFAHRDGASWFYKLQGPDAVLTAQKPVFVEFLKTVRIKEAGAPAAEVAKVAAPAAAEPEPEFKWKVPEGWQTLPAGQMQVAKFGVPARDGAKAEVFVSVFPSDTGGALANVNRWRRQLGLEPVDDAGLKALVAPLDTAPGAILVDLKNDARAMLGAIVPRGERWWFYKLMGDTAAVTAEREAFIRFVQTAP